jgi:hypothetical protein
MDLRPLGPKVLIPRTPCTARLSKRPCLKRQGVNMAFSAESICGANNDRAIGQSTFVPDQR